MSGEIAAEVTDEMVIGALNVWHSNVKEPPAVWMRAVLEAALSSDYDQVAAMTALKLRRLLRGLTLEQAAEQLEVAPRSLHRWEKQGSIPQDRGAVGRLRAFYGCSLDELWPSAEDAA